MSLYAKVLPFKFRTDVAKIGEMLYGDHDQQCRGMNLCRSYQARGPLPPAINLTALLVSATHNDIPSNDLYAIRLVYSMALIRFVNEMLDSQQTGKVAAPLHALAKSLGLPSALVEVRHAATHETLPTIYLLRQLASQALEWLWCEFWSLNTVSDPGAAYSEEDVMLSSADDLKEQLRIWRRLRRSDPNAKLSAEEQHVVSVIHKFYELGGKQSVFSQVLFDQGTLIPKGPSAAQKRAKLSVQLYGPLFNAMSVSFRSELLHQLVQKRNSEQWPNFGDPSDPSFEGYDVWILHFATAQPQQAKAHLVELPRPWNAKLLATLANVVGDRGIYSQAESMAGVLDAEIAPFEPTVSKPERFIWPKAPNWSSRNIGEA